MEKINKLENILSEMGSVLVAYSGGVDSSFLLKVAKDVLGNKVLAVTASSDTYPQEELRLSKKVAKNLKVRHRIIQTSELKNRNFIKNPVNRCYFCKKELFRRLNKIAQDENLKYVIDASNVSDKTDFRPGEKAKKELGVRSPLVEAGFTKEDIRNASKKLKLPTWDKPSLACLSSRIPYGVSISKAALDKISQGENFLRKLGFKQVRIRHYDGFARIEVEKNKIPLLIKKKETIVEKLKNLGYNYITIDLEGYRTGSMNEVIKK